MTVATQAKQINVAEDVSEIIYTICPVLVASHIAVEKGWLENELKKKKAS